MTGNRPQDHAKRAQQPGINAHPAAEPAAPLEKPSTTHRNGVAASKAGVNGVIMRKIHALYATVSFALAMSVASVSAQQSTTAPTVPSITSSVLAGASVISGTAQRPDTNNSVQVSVCVWQQQPTVETSLDCVRSGKTQEAKLTNAANDQCNCVLVDSNGSFTAKLSNPLVAGNYISVTEIATPNGNDPQSVPSTEVYLVGELPEGAVSDVMISPDHPTSEPVVNAKSIDIKYVNKFRYQFSLASRITVTAAPAAPTGIIPGVGTFPAPPAVKSPPTGGKEEAKSKTPAPDVGTQFQAMESGYQTLFSNVSALDKKIADLVDGANFEQACYKAELHEFSGLFLSPGEVRLLATDANGNNGNKCMGDEPETYLWPTDDAFTDISTATTLENSYHALAALLDYATWYATNKTIFDDHISQLDALKQHLVLLTSASTTRTALDVSVVYITYWRNRFAGIKSGGTSDWEISQKLTCKDQWFGKSKTEVVALHYQDLSVDTPTDQSVDLVTNTCLPPLTVSTGIGISKLGDKVYGFVPQTTTSTTTSSGTSTTTSTTTQVIGLTSDSSVLPIYVLQMNYGYWEHKGFGAHVTVGGAVSTSGSGATLNFLLGHAFSFARRAVFVTPAIELGQRQDLQSGYKVTDPMGTLNSVPTVNRWHPAFAVIFSIPVSQ